MKKLSIILFLLFGLLAQVNAQEKITYFGEVRDTLGTPLQFANVLAIDTVTNKMAAFGVTNPQGQFRLSLDANKTYKLQATFIGYLPFEGIFSPKESNSIPFRITLKNDVTQLSDVEVVQEMPVLIQGDTITYKAEVFTDGNERKLEDVLEDLPGFEVNEDGGVTVQGKEVSKVLVDGKEFFEGDTKLATKNLPANVVDKVQVLQNFNDVSPLSAVNNSEEIALNIQLKEDKKNIVFGDIEAGGGPQGRYLAHANTFYYNPKTNINFIGDANNVGMPAFTMRDYFRFSGGFGNFSNSSGSSFNVTSNDLGIPMAERDNARDLNNQLGAFNYNFTPTDKWRISGFAIGSRVDNTLGSISRRTYILQPGDNEELLATESNVQSLSGLGKVGVKYVPNADLQIDYNLFARTSDLETTSLSNSVFAGGVNEIRGYNAQQPVAIEQQLRGFWAANEKDILSFEGSYKYQFQDPLFDLLTTQRPFEALIPTQGTSPFNLLQFKEVTTHNQEAAFNYYRVLNKTNHINFRIGNVYSAQTLTSEIVERAGEQDLPIDDQQLQNDVDFTFKDFYASLLYKTKWGDLELTPSLNLHYYDVVNRQLGEENGFNKTLLLPAVNARYNFRQSHSLTLNYNVRADFTDIQNVARGLIVRNYNNLFAGNPTLSNGLFHNVNVNYFNFNMYNFLNIYGGLNYTKQLDAISNIIQFDGLERINVPINIDAANEVMSAYASIDKRFDAFRLALSANWSRSLTNNIISDTRNLNEAFTQSYKTTFNTRLWKIFQLELAYQVGLSDYSGLGNANSFQNHQPSANLEFDFLKGFTFEVDYQYNRYVNNGTGNAQVYDLMDAKLRYRQEGSPWEFKVEGMNLFDTRGVRLDSFNASLISTYEYFIQQRYVIFTVMFDL
jgi:hypothetical protein